jgi:hypothetical protein
VGNVTRRLFHRIVATDFASVPAPYQVAMGTQGAAAQLVFGVREVLERFHELAGHKMDQKNAFNKFRRCECGELLEAFEKLKPLRPLVVKCLGPITALVLDGACEGDLIAPFGSEEGGQQGDPLTRLLFCVWFHSHLAFAERFLRGEQLQPDEQGHLVEVLHRRRVRQGLEPPLLADRHWQVRDRGGGERGRSKQQ